MTFARGDLTQPEYIRYVSIEATVGYNTINENVLGQMRSCRTKPSNKDRRPSSHIASAAVGLFEKGSTVAVVEQWVAPGLETMLVATAVEQWAAPGSQTTVAAMAVE
uniref:Uncharacterized protein n=1 Tax=Oryza punctata TaxID=4537 RepID=A0A0E0KM05_ORYPU